MATMNDAEKFVSEVIDVIKYYSEYKGIIDTNLFREILRTSIIFAFRKLGRFKWWLLKKKNLD